MYIQISQLSQSCLVTVDKVHALLHNFSKAVSRFKIHILCICLLSVSLIKISILCKQRLFVLLFVVASAPRRMILQWIKHSINVCEMNEVGNKDTTVKGYAV